MDGRLGSYLPVDFLIVLYIFQNYLYVIKHIPIIAVLYENDLILI
jgi:hypothetical protein